ncbi:acid phosphatase type 7-like [Lineus longissimus]|uniref:acid phosphatase type 7-like n=1 Tax=Lineus longissimus TaxID=88925 RepID=UPI00315D1911
MTIIAHDVTTDLHQQRFTPTGKTSWAPTKAKVVAGIFIIMLLTLGISYPLNTVAEDAVLKAEGHIGRVQGHIGHVRDHLGLPSSPSQVHGCVGDTPRTFVIMWATDTYADSIVVYGSQPNMLKLSAKGRCLKLTSLMEEGSPYLHRVELQHLDVNQVYYYRAVSHGRKSALFHFKTWPSNDHNWSPRFLVYGDLGVRSTLFRSLKQDVAKDIFHGILHIGDLAYALSGHGGAVGDEFMRKISTFSGNISYFTSPGDHENHAEFLHYRYRFSMPSTTWPIPLSKMWYSFDAGLAHVISISSEVYNDKYRYLYKFAMYRWLVNDLASANMNRAHRPWIIVVGHKPMYCSNRDNKIDCENTKVRKDLEDLFFQQGVDLYISGHEHSYERTWPVYRGQVWGKSYRDPGATVQLVIGFGAVEYSSDIFAPEQPQWSAFRTNEPELNGYGRLFIENITHLYWEVFSPKTAKIVDKMVIVQNRHGSFKIFGNMSNAPIIRSPSIPFLMPMFYEVSAGISTENYLLLLCCVLFVAIFIICRRRFPFLTKRFMFSIGGSKRTGNKLSV